MVSNNRKVAAPETGPLLFYRMEEPKNLGIQLIKFCSSPVEFTLSGAEASHSFTFHNSIELFTHPGELR